jgi:hypothetical protein
MTNTQINRVLDANGLPIPHFDEHERDKLLPAYRQLSNDEVARVLATEEIERLTWCLHEAAIHAP